MQLQHLYIRNFRNYEEAEVSFSSGINLIHGPNAEGKTNLLEAIYLLSTGSSFRTLYLSELICYKQPHFYLEAHMLKDGLTQTIKISFDGKIRYLQYNHTTYASFAPLLGLFPTVLFAPEDIALINGAPSERRRFLDLHIAQID
ncbi:MAG: DNA replication/repair protein RecF, partial [Anaerolineae bacterium]